MATSPTDEPRDQASPRGTPAWLYPALALASVGVVGLALAVHGWYSRWGGFWGTAFGLVLAVPIAGVASLIAVPFALSMSRATGWRAARTKAASLLLWLGTFGAVTLVTNLVFYCWPKEVRTLERPGLGAYLPPPRTLPQPPPSGILDLAVQLGFPYSLGGDPTLAVIDPQTGSFASLSLSPAIRLERSHIFPSSSSRRWVLLESDDSPARPPRVYQ